MHSICMYAEKTSKRPAPSVKELIQENAHENKDVILAYLKSFEPIAYAPGVMRDAINGNRIPGAMFCASDGEYEWQTEEIYYFEKYNIKLNEDFIAHVLSKVK